MRGNIKRKLPIVIALMGLMLSTSILALSLSFASAKSGTNEIGIISKDTTWTLANSPYNITGNVTVNSRVTLTIEAGITVISKNYQGNGIDNPFYAYLAVDGTLIAKGSSNTPITFNDTQINFSPSSSGWNQQTSSGSIIEKCFLLTPKSTSILHQK